MWTLKFRKASIMYRVAAAKCKCLLDMKMDRGTASTSEISDSLEQLICWACLKTECELMEETNLDVSRLYDKLLDHLSITTIYSSRVGIYE